MFACLETFETIKALHQREHNRHENMICKQHFKWSEIMKRAFEFTKQIITIKNNLV